MPVMTAPDDAIDVPPRRVVLFHAPRSRSSGTLALLEELGAEHEVELLDLTRNEQREARYLNVNPMGKVPAILHNGVLVTEQVAITIHLADLYPEAGLAPAIGEPLRGAWLRWIAFYGSTFEPAMVDRALGRDGGNASTSPYGGDADAVVAVLAAQLGDGPWLLGSRYTAADVLWGSALGWMLRFGVVASTPAFEAYAARVAARDGVQRALARDAQWIGARKTAG